MTAFRFDGREIPFVHGQSIGAALTSAGIVTWRHTRREAKPRGLFCGIGVCFDCLITVDGHPNERACLVRATEGSEVATQDGTGFDDSPY